MKTMEIKHGKKATGHRLSYLLKKLKDRFITLFEPEEVEVTFDRDGESSSYTYTKVQH